MNSTTDSSRVGEWLREQLGLTAVRSVWIYGSFIHRPDSARDIDILVIYEDGHVDFAVDARRRIERLFFSSFGRPLHALFLSQSELDEEADMVARILSSSRSFAILDLGRESQGDMRK